MTSSRIHEALMQPKRKYGYPNQSRFLMFSSESESDFSQSSEEEAQVVKMSVAEAKEKITQYKEEFFSTRNLEEAEVYFVEFPAIHHYLLVDDLVYSSVESTEADARLAGDLFSRAALNGLCSPAAFQEGLALTAEFLDDIAIDAPSAPDLLAIMMTFGPQSTFSSGKKDKRESIQRTNSSSQNMFSMLQNSEASAEPSAPKGMPHDLFA